MKPEELQLGDIVTTTPSGMPIKVVAIHRKKVAYHACTDRFSWVRIGLLQPIPLTPEILKKNGFNLSRDKSGIGILDTYWLGEGIGFRLHNFETDYYQFGLAKIRYVHQLQHALRLCGISKNIEI